METASPPRLGAVANSSPSTSEIVIGILALVLALAAVAVAVIQVQQARVTRVRRTDTESQYAIELSTPSNIQRPSAQVPIVPPSAAISRRYCTRSI
jgi:uncharacterized protein HemX